MTTALDVAVIVVDSFPMERIWQAVEAENLVRHRSGTFYLQAKVGGKKIRQSLGTSSLKVAKIKRDSKLAAMRSAATNEPTGIRTLGDAIALAVNRRLSNPNLKDRSRQYYQEVIATLRKTLPTEIPAAAWTKDAAARWWSSLNLSPSRANNALSLVKDAAAAIKEAGLRLDDPTAGLKRRRLPKSGVDELPERKAFEAVVASIRAQKKAYSEEAANMVEFLAFSGCRIGELRLIEWSHVGEDWLAVPDGKSGARRVPISALLRGLISRMTYDGADGPLFSMVSPREALAAACRRCGVPHMRVHDLRHLFATAAVEAGVDIPTVSKWLGHKDGGALAMRTYSHLRDQHSLAQIKKLG